jgi:hypothetical protein
MANFAPALAAANNSRQPKVVTTALCSLLPASFLSTEQLTPH